MPTSSSSSSSLLLLLCVVTSISIRNLSIVLVLSILDSRKCARQAACWLSCCTLQFDSCAWRQSLRRRAVVYQSSSPTRTAACTMRLNPSSLGNVLCRQEPTLRHNTPVNQPKSTNQSTRLMLCVSCDTTACCKDIVHFSSLTSTQQLFMHLHRPRRHLNSGLDLDTLDNVLCCVALPTQDRRQELAHAWVLVAHSNDHDQFTWLQHFAQQAAGCFDKRLVSGHLVSKRLQQHKIFCVLWQQRQIPLAWHSRFRW
jgi:hypothetical protein